MTQIAVLIPHYNSTEALIKSIKSIDEDIELDLFVIDDGSNKKPKIEELTFYKNGKIFLDGYDNNKGIEYALNYGLKKIKDLGYPFIARLDCADICASKRFQKQYKFLNNNKDIFMVGSWVKLIDEKGKFLFNLKLPIIHNEIARKSYLNAMFIHPTVFFRTIVLDSVGYYPTNYPAAEDYAYFFKIIRKHKTANIPEYLLNVEVNTHGISSVRRKKQVKSRIQVILDNFYFGFWPVYGLIRNLLLLFMPRKLTTTLKTILKK